jgi:co-chaperonin GroES (HSP10)
MEAPQYQSVLDLPFDVAPLFDYVLIRPEPDPGEIGSRIIRPFTPPTASIQLKWGRVIRVGEGAPDSMGGTMGPEVSPGQLVFFSTASASKVRIGGEEMFFCQDQFIWLVAEQEQEDEAGNDLDAGV